MPKATCLNSGVIVAVRMCRAGPTRHCGGSTDVLFWLLGARAYAPRKGTCFWEQGRMLSRARHLAHCGKSKGLTYPGQIGHGNFEVATRCHFLLTSRKLFEVGTSGVPCCDALIEHLSHQLARGSSPSWCRSPSAAPQFRRRAHVWPVLMHCFESGSSPVPSHHVHLKPLTVPVPLQREQSPMALSSQW